MSTFNTPAGYRSWLDYAPTHTRSDSTKRDRQLARARSNRQRLVDQCRDHGLKATIGTGRRLGRRTKPTTIARMRRLLRKIGKQPCY